MILAAGRGTRMLSLSDKTPKPLLCVHDKSLIEHRIIACKKAGITDIVINVWHHANLIQTTLGDGSQWGVNIAYSIEDHLLGSGGGIKNALPLLGHAPFLLLSADVFSDIGLSSFAKRKTNSCHLALVDNPDHHPEGDYHLDHNTISLKGTPKLTYAGTSLIDPKWIANITDTTFSIASAFEAAIAAHLATGEHFQALWINVDTPLRLKRACSAREQSLQDI